MNLKLIADIKRDYPEVALVAASKYIDADHIRILYENGQFDFGENRANELAEKAEALADCPDIRFHFIGHLQSNKIDLVLPYIKCLHSLDSLSLAKRLQNKLTSPLDCFVEVKLVDNPNKHGVPREKLGDFLDGLSEYSKINVIGLMAMTDDDMNETEKRRVFQQAFELGKAHGLNQFSMGMSDDYVLAIEEGSTCIRLGRTLYSKEDCIESYQRYFD